MSRLVGHFFAGTACHRITLQAAFFGLEMGKTVLNTLGQVMAPMRYLIRFVAERTAAKAD
jgi:hypothetical protein